MHGNSKKSPAVNRKRKQAGKGTNNSNLKAMRLERESTFTGKSIKIVTKNNETHKKKEKKTPIKNFSSSSETMSRHRRKSPEPSFLSPPKKPLPAKVVITNLHLNVTREDIQELFGAIGEVRTAALKSVGTAEVTYSIAEDAFAAYSKYHGRNLDGQPMVLKITTADEAAPTPASDFLSARSSSKSSAVSSQQYYEPPGYSGGRSSTSTKPVVFTVKL